MSDPLAPPPRRPAPEPLRDEIASRLRRASAARRVRVVLIPLAAAVMVATVVVGAAVLGGRPSLQPVQTASPYPTTASPTPPRRTAASPTPSVTTASMNLDVRPMSKAEIAADTRSCLRRVHPDDEDPRRGAIRVLYAMVQIQAGVSGPVPAKARRLILQDEAGTWFCENGKNPSWTAGSSLTSGDPQDTQLAMSGSFNGNCEGDTPKVSTEVLFAVGEEVALGRTRISVGSAKGPWQVSRPDRRMVNFRLLIEGKAARAESVAMEFEMLDRRGDRVTIHRNEQAGEPDTGRTAKMDLRNCADFEERRAERTPVTRPVDDQAGLRTCLDMVKESARNVEVPFSSQWKPRLVISTKQRWGAVLSDGANLVGCSLFPTKEISPFSPDTGTVARSSFFFAVNPIDGAQGASLWAAGKVPTDVSAISYRLPGGQDVAAKIDGNGYWMLMYHSDTTDIAEGNVADWEPIEVTVKRPQGTEKFSIRFTEETMCRQVSHGC